MKRREETRGKEKTAEVREGKRRREEAIWDEMIGRGDGRKLKGEGSRRDKKRERGEVVTVRRGEDKR